MKAQADRRIDRRHVRGRLAFDLDRFDTDLFRVCNQRGLSRRRAAEDIGIPSNTLYCITHRGAIPNGTGLAAICKWAGLNAADYSLNLEDYE